MEHAAHAQQEHVRLSGHVWAGHFQHARDLDWLAHLLADASDTALGAALRGVRPHLQGQKCPKTFVTPTGCLLRAVAAAALAAAAGHAVWERHGEPLPAL